MNPMRHLMPVQRLWLGAALSLWAGAAAAEGSVLLTVVAADGAQHEFDMAALDALPQISFTTSTIWTDGKMTFSGPALRNVLGAGGIDKGVVHLVALNDYAVDLDLAGTDDKAPIIATRINGAEFGVRDNGPLWIVYPFDSDLRYQDEVVYSASVWQLVRAEAVVP